MTLQQFCEQLKEKIKKTYEVGVTMNDAESMAGEFLYVQILIAEERKKVDLDSRMKKTSVKAIRAALYLDIVSKSDKKPTEGQISAMLDSNELVIGEQKALDEAEVERDDLERYSDIFHNAQITYRGIAKGSFE